MAEKKVINNNAKSKKVFINCPFDKEYLVLLRPFLFSLLFLGFEPLIASLRNDTTELRMNKVMGFIGDSDLGIHDVSRVQAENAGDSFRLNMPFELGIDWGYKHFVQPKRQILILGGKKHSLGRALSDIAGCDPQYHENEAEQLVRLVRNWLIGIYPDKEFPGGSEVWDHYNYFFFSLYESENRSNEDVESMPISEYLTNIRKWLEKNNKKN